MSNRKFVNEIFNTPPKSYWIDSTAETNYPALDKNINVDIAIIGGGIVGITAAYLLQKEGFKVAVIEANKIAHGTSAHTTAKITSQHGLIYNNLKKQMGEDKAKQYAEANESAIRFIENTVKENNIDCDFSLKSAYIYTKDNNYIKAIEDEVDAAKSLGIDAYYMKEIPLPFTVKAAMRFDNQAQFHPRKYLLAISNEISNKGVKIFENTRAVDIEEGDELSVVTEKGFKIHAKRIIISTHFPFYDGKGFYFSRMYVEKSYIIAIKTNEPFPEGMFINAEDPPRSMRSQRYKDGEMVIIAGENHKVGDETDTNSRYNNLIEFANETFKTQNILYRWSAQDCMTVDDVPYIGNLTSKTPNIYVATGFKKWGMTSGTAAALIIKDLIVKGDSPYLPVFYPSRTDISASAEEFINQNADVVKELVTGKLKAAPKDFKLENGEGRAVEVDGKKIGAYKDNKGNIHMVDKTCTHLGCELKWNDGEKSWDCPCHGSRFSIDGDIIEGPASKPLNHPDEQPNKINPNIFG